jgi:NDP-sugar pyrophosphorylase family protein
MKAMLLAAGLGERMFPLTLSRPKPVIPVLGRPIAMQLLHWLAGHGVDAAVLNLHHLPEVVEQEIGSGGSAGLPPIQYTYEPEILGTAGGIRNAARLLRGNGPIVVCNSDFLSDIDLGAALAQHRASGLPVTLVLTPARDGYSVVEVDRASRVIALAGRPRTDAKRVAGRYLFTGCQIMEEQVLERIPEAGPSDIVRDVYWGMAEEGLLGGYLHEGFWWEFGSPGLYLDGSMALIDGPRELRRRVSADQDDVRELDGGIAAVGPGVQFHQDARLTGRAALGYASHVREETTLRDCVIMPEAWVGPGCRLERCIVGVGVELPADFRSRGELICTDPGLGCDLPGFTRSVKGLLVTRFDEQDAWS